MSTEPVCDCETLTTGRKAHHLDCRAGAEVDQLLYGDVFFRWSGAPFVADPRAGAEENQP